MKFSGCLLRVGHDLLQGHLGAGRQARQGRRSAHELQHVAAAHYRLLGTGVVRELALHEIAILRSIGQFFQPPPHTLFRRLLQLGLDLHQVERSVGS